MIVLTIFPASCCLVIMGAGIVIRLFSRFLS
jgi:hypothetical protein